MNEKPIDRDSPESESDNYPIPIFADAEEERRYWHSRTPAERLIHVERLRRIKYGPAALERMARVLEVVRLEDGYINLP
jgi:hypothetical protein